MEAGRNHDPSTKIIDEPFEPFLSPFSRFSILMNVRWGSTYKSIASISILRATDAKIDRSRTVEAITFEAHS